MGAQNSWQDYVAPDAPLPSAGWLLAAFGALYSLWVAKNDMKLRMAVLAILVAVVTVWYSYDSVQKLRSNRDVETNIKTLLALSGLSTASVNQVLISAEK
jgi:formate hydrogenlyase subunit 3/multisubunit Na+/H+ antiporter MnhD subunit